MPYRSRHYTECGAPQVFSRRRPRHPPNAGHLHPLRQDDARHHRHLATVTPKHRTMPSGARRISALPISDHSLQAAGFTTNGEQQLTSLRLWMSCWSIGSHGFSSLVVSVGHAAGRAACPLGSTGDPK